MPFLLVDINVESSINTNEEILVCDDSVVYGLTEITFECSKIYGSIACSFNAVNKGSYEITHKRGEIVSP